MRTAGPRGSFNIGKVSIGKGHPFVLIAGPCVIESEDSVIRHARILKEITRKAGVPFIFKASYDKANRTSTRSFRGPGLKKGLRILGRVKEKFGVPVTSDVHGPDEIRGAAGVLDVLQIPAFLCRQTDLLTAAAKTGKAVNVKKGQFLAPWDIGNIIDKVASAGNDRVIITERGVSFGYNNLVSDFRSILIMKDFGCPVCYDATHSVQRPGGLGDKSAGEARFVPALSRAAVACGADALFIEVHENPGAALSDGPNMIKLDELPGLLAELKAIEAALAGRVKG
ncbi:MAG: 3-deoxy-8-phosphooctulonate synthase [Candidatus Omnitrophota bacterium]